MNLWLESDNAPLIIYVRIIDMKFTEAVSKCYKKYFKFKGRASRSEYWWFVLLAILFAWPLLLTELETGFWYTILSFIYFMLTLSVAFPLISVWVRRMHDVNKSGWVWLFFLIPIIGLILLIRWSTKEGDREANKFGEPESSSGGTTKPISITPSET
jgi:uncharacterized membrane protein YhaH (DUF805 family)